MAQISISYCPKFGQVIYLQLAVIDNAVVSTQTFNIRGLDPDGLILVNAPLLEGGLFISPSIPQRDVLSLQIWNTTDAPITPAFQPFRVFQP